MNKAFAPYTAYTIVVTVEGVRLVYGNLPIQDFVDLTKGKKSWVMDPSLCRLADAQQAFGSLDAVSRCYERMLHGVEGVAKRAEYKSLWPALSDAAIVWLLGKDTGASSVALLFKTHGIEPSHPFRITKGDYPRDAWDFRRVVLLKDSVPEVAQNLNTMVDFSPQWAALLSKWTEAESLLREEVGDLVRPKKGVSAPRTNALIDQINQTPSVCRPPG